MNFKTTAILLIVLLAAGVAVYLTRDNGSKPETVTPESEKKLVTFNTADVQQISIESAGGQKIVLKREGMNWRLTEPLDTPADSVIPNEILTDLSGLQSTGKSTTSGDDLAATGLQPPHFKVELNTKDGKSIKLDVGDRSGTGGGLYVRLDGDKQANLVAADVYDQLDKPVSEFRRKKLLDVNTTDISHVEVDRPEGKLVLQKTGSNWAIQQPTTMPADSSAVSDMLFGLSNLQATDFVSETDTNPRRYGLDKPALTVSYTAAPASTQPASEPAPTVVKFGFLDLQKKNVYLTTSAGQTVAQVAASTLDTFKKKPLELRDKQVLNVDPATISTVTIQTNLPATTQPTTRPASDKTVALARRPAPAPTSAPAITSPATTAPATVASTEPASKPAASPTKWLIASTQPADASDSKVTALLSALHPLKADKYLEAPEASDKPQDHYTLLLESNPPLIANYKIELTDPGNSKPLVGSYNGLTFEVDRTLLDKLKADFTHTANDSSSTDATPASNAPNFPGGPPGGGPPGAPAP